MTRRRSPWWCLLLLALGDGGCATTTTTAPHGQRMRRRRPRRARTNHETVTQSSARCPVRAGSAPASRTDDEESVEDIAFDLAHVCARMGDGTVRCMGENHHGELGPTARGATLRIPTDIDGLGESVEVITGRRLTCARHRDGSVRCIGSAEAGQLGTGSDPTPSPEGTFLPVRGVSGATRLSTSMGTTCALVGDGTLLCWGRETEATALAYPGLSGVAEFDLDGLFHGCARFTNGTLRCGRFARPIPVTDATQLDAGQSHACARRRDGSVRCWGFNSSGQLGALEPPPDMYTPVDPGLQCVVQVVAGGDHTCALITDGTVRCWGSNHFGQIGDGSTLDRPVPVSVRGVSEVVRLVAGPTTTCGIREDRSVVCWGSSLWLPGRLPEVMRQPQDVVW